jgi:L-histidine Nalpha-methyltransferase
VPFNFEELLKDSINEFGLGWTLCFVGESQSKKLAALTQDLRRGFSTTGDEKRIVSGFSYWGIGPTIAWAYACTDPLYVVMKESIESFRYRWQQIESNLDVGKYHYVSLGVGTGEKDRDILSCLLNTHPDLLYFPIDMSSQMLRMGVQGATKGLGLKGNRVLPFQLDFSTNKNILELRKLLERVVGDSPILFSLLGNTLANFQQDTELLQTLSKLMRQHDKMLIEVAATDDLSDEVAQEAMSEYANSKSFKEFVTSALLQNTDIQIDLNNVVFHSFMEADKAISIKVVYTSRGNILRLESTKLYPTAI